MFGPLVERFSSTPLDIQYRSVRSDIGSSFSERRNFFWALFACLKSSSNVIRRAFKVKLARKVSITVLTVNTVKTITPANLPRRHVYVLRTMEFVKELPSRTSHQLSVPISPTQDSLASMLRREGREQKNYLRFATVIFLAVKYFPSCIFLRLSVTVSLPR